MDSGGRGKYNKWSMPKSMNIQHTRGEAEEEEDLTVKIGSGKRTESSNVYRVIERVVVATCDGTQET